MVCSLEFPAKMRRKVILMPMFSDACNRGTPTRSKQRDDKCTASPPASRITIRHYASSDPSRSQEFRSDAEQVSLFVPARGLGVSCFGFARDSTRTAVGSSFLAAIAQALGGSWQNFESTRAPLVPRLAFNEFV